MPGELVEKVATLHPPSSLSVSNQVILFITAMLSTWSAEAHLLQNRHLSSAQSWTTKSSFLLVNPESECHSKHSSCIDNATFTRGLRDHHFSYVLFLMLTGFRYEFTIRAHFIANSVPEEFVFLEFAAHDNQKSYTTAGLASDDAMIKNVEESAKYPKNRPVISATARTRNSSVQSANNTVAP